MEQLSLCKRSVMHENRGAKSRCCQRSVRWYKKKMQRNFLLAVNLTQTELYLQDVEFHRAFKMERRCLVRVKASPTGRKLLVNHIMQNIPKVLVEK